MVLESNALHKFHGAMVGTCQEVVQHASYKLLPGGRRKIQNNLLGDELVIKVGLKNEKGSICFSMNSV